MELDIKFSYNFLSCSLLPEQAGVSWTYDNYR